MNTTDHPGAFHVIDAMASSGLRDVVISPGSRNAPLVIACEAHPRIRTTVALDERSAAHIALGMGLKNRIPAAVISTSGTAAINHGPAIAEAAYQCTPLISITADRPVASRGQGLGQTVLQTKLFEAHALLELEVDETKTAVDEMRSMASDAMRVAAKGPVHVNMPFAEPLYGVMEREWKEWEPMVGEVGSASAPIPALLLDYLCVHDPRILLIGGASSFDEKSFELAGNFPQKLAAFSDVFGHIRGEGIAGASDRLLSAFGGKIPEDLRPSCVVTIGLPPMSAAWRSEVASWRVPHWHIGLETKVWEMFGGEPQSWKTAATDGLELLLDALPSFSSYAASWQVALDRISRAEEQAVEQLARPWCDWTAFDQLSKKMKRLESLHFANSTSARYAQWFDWDAVRLHANRGVAGIDGCLSTAVGDALMHPDQKVGLITGDAAWLYDLNGLHVRPFPKNLRVVLINNGGGNIFRWIQGPEELGLLPEFFEVPFLQNSEATAQAGGLDYFCAESPALLDDVFELWDNNPRPSLLEIRTDGELSAKFYHDLQKVLFEQMGSTERIQEKYESN